jgi:chromosome segregation ATPase
VNFKSNFEEDQMKPAKTIDRSVPSAEHEQIVVDLQQTIAGYAAHRRDQATELDEARRRNGALASQVQKLQIDLARAASALKAKTVELEDAQRMSAEAARDFRDARAESAHLRCALATARDATAEAMIMLAEARDDARARCQGARCRKSDEPADGRVRV